MSIRLVFRAFIVSSCLVGAAAHADNEFLWDNAQGFISAEKCQVKAVKVLDIQVSQAAILLDKYGKNSLKAVDGALFRIQDDVASITNNGEVSKAVRLIGVPSEADLKGKPQFAGKGDGGYLPASQVGDLRNYEFMITHATHSKDQSNIDKVGTTDTKLVGSIWRAAVTGRQFMSYVCGEKIYSIFEVTAKEGGSAVARVGVVKDSTTIFTSIDAHKIGETTPAKTAVQASEPVKVPESISTPPSVSASEPIPMPHARPLDAPKAKTDAAQKSTGKVKAKVTERPAENYAGQVCRRSDTDARKCMICVMQGEATVSSQAGMVAVGRTIMERYSNHGYPHNVCKISYASGQFIGLRPGMHITSNRQDVARLTAAANTALDKGGNGYLGFRSCSYSRSMFANGNPRRGVPIGGNCFRRMGELEDPLNLVTVDMASAAGKQPQQGNLVQVASEEELERVNSIPASLLSTI